MIMHTEFEQDKSHRAFILAGGGLRSIGLKAGGAFGGEIPTRVDGGDKILERIPLVCKV